MRNSALFLLTALDNPIGKLFAAVTLPNVHRARDVHAHTQAYERATRLTTLLRVFRLRHGEYPESLQALDELASLDRLSDPCSGEPFRYHRQGTGYVLYSVGLDLDDDGGTLDYEQRARSGIKQLDDTDLIYSLSAS